MAQTRFTHRGHAVVIDHTPNAPKISIDGEALNVSEIAPSLFANNLMPHTNFNSLDVLVKAVIDQSPAFHGRRDG
jgi:hypothetical protein